LKRLSDNSISIAEASNVARGLQGRSGTNGGGGSTSRPSAGSAPGINGPRAGPTQPSAVNRDLRDLQKVLGSGQDGGLIAPETAQKIFTNAAITAYTRESVGGGVPFVINPDSFDFAPDPSTKNWQKTSCVRIRFGYGSPLLPRMQFDVGVVVGAPLELRDGRRLSVREAQLDSANAATAAAYQIIALLDSDLIIPSEVQPRFVGFMGGAILTTGLGYRVNGCRPSQPKTATPDQIDI